MRRRDWKEVPHHSRCLRGKLLLQMKGAEEDQGDRWTPLVCWRKVLRNCRRR